MSRSTGREIIGIAGPTCSGKTSLLRMLLERMPSTAVGFSMDEYDLFPAGSAAVEEELRNPTITNWESPDLFDLEQLAVDLRELAEGRSVRIGTRSRESLATGETERLIEPARYIFVEGLFALHHPAAHAIMDLTVYVDIHPDIMVARRLNTMREGSDGNPWDNPAYICGAMVDGTEEFVSPQLLLAHMRLNGAEPTEHLADQVMGQLR